MNFLYDNKKILVVSKSLQKDGSLLSDLKLLGFKSQNIKLTQNRDNAWDLINQNDFNLIVSDLERDSLPDLELLTSVKNDEKLKKIAFLIVGPDIDEHKKSEVLAAGASDYITKPLEIDIISLAVQKVMLEISSILVVDDSEFFRGVIKEILRELKFKTILEGSDGLEGLEAIKAAHENGIDIDLIICDWEMPNMDGLGLLKALKDNPKTKNIPFIILTAHNDEKRILSAIQSGATDYVIRSDPETLAKKINKIFDIYTI